MDYLLSCQRGGFPHNEIRDFTGTLLTEVCSDVKVEPELQEITTETMSLHTANTTEGARLDITANGFWVGRHERTFLDVRVFNPLAPSNRQTSASQNMKKKRNVPTCMRNRTCHFYPSGNVSYRRSSKRSHQLLQATGIPPCR